MFGSPKAIIVPHAGYIYSGCIAASAYAALAHERALVRRMVLLGPAHFVPFRGIAAPEAVGFATPLGVVPVDSEAIQSITAKGLVATYDKAHKSDHSLEVQLPFLQLVLEQFAIVPLLVGEATPEEVATVIEHLWGGPETRFVISSDLSHYLDWAAAQKLDQATAAAIEALEPQRIGEHQACGRIPLCGLLQAASAHHLRARTLDLRSSGDTSGPRDKVVGYGSFALCQP